VSILCFDCVRQREKLPLARNAFKKFRTIRHPDLIKYIDGIEVLLQECRGCYGSASSKRHTELADPLSSYFYL
jgi:hypothetical protein